MFEHDNSGDLTQIQIKANKDHISCNFELVIKEVSPSF